MGDMIVIFFMFMLLMFFQIVIAYFMATFFTLPSRESGGFFSFLWSSTGYIFGLLFVAWMTAIVESSGSENQLDYYWILHLPNVIVFFMFTVLYFRRLGYIFNGFGEFTRPLLAPFIFIVKIPFGIMKNIKDKKKKEDIFKKFDNF